MDLNQDTRARVLTVANSLYEEGGRSAFPTVDAVRRAAKVDMNAASLLMREWRRMQTASPAPLAVAVPDRLRQAQDGALAALWAEAQEISNEALKAAQSAWDAERDQAESLRAELAAAFETERSELEAATARLADLERELQLLRDTSAATARELRAVDEARAAAEGRAAVAEQRAEELANRVADLKTELSRTHHESDRLRAERDQAAQTSDAASARLESLRDELATVKARAHAEREAHAEQRKVAAQEAQRSAERLTKAQAERDQALRDVGRAREEAARLSGQVEALQTQYAIMKQLAAESAAAGKAARAPTSKGAK